ncbi:MAG: carbohydrate porin [Desulfobacterales bacterium]
MATVIKKKRSIFLVSLFLMFVLPSMLLSYDINEKLSLEGTLTGVYQYGDFDIKGLEDADRGAVVFDVGANFHPTESDEFQLTLGHAAGNGLNSVNPFSLAPYADDLEDDLEDINGRNRDYLLEAWYKRTFKFSDDMKLAITGGIIDSNGYIDDNAFAKDETGQFMNDIFVNSTLANLPSYDIGGAAELDIADFSIRAVVMNSRNETDDNYNYYALQLGYSPDTSLGKGNYRVYGYTTGSEFEDWDEGEKEKLQGIGLSMDQELNSILGVFARIGWQDDDAVVDHDSLYSGGINISGELWGREDDAAGLGYAYLEGADKGEIDNTHAVEAYVKFQLCEFSDFTLDAQYVKDKMRDEANRDGFTYGLRMNAYF